LHGNLGFLKNTNVNVLEKEQKVLLLGQFPKMGELDTFSVFFGGR